jgi:hypothetical protein
MSTKHHVYLAIPGRQFCWGTTTGVINSTKDHVVHPFNGGLGFSGVIDFNLLWADAHNLAEAGTITHFAMLHGDIVPDPEQRWLDILLEEMDMRNADLVSAHLPIKDHRGVTSCGICDPTFPWGAFRRFTQREILHGFPETFNNVMVGYPDKPLLHNTGCWVCDLRKPIFKETNPDGSLKLFFRFPERIIRDQNGKWEHQQESEDWCFSRELWQAGATNTWITKRIRATHKGGMDWDNWVTFGTFQDGDDNTAARWREDRDAKPLSLTQMLNFELGSGCNLSSVHTECPNRSALRYASLDTSNTLDDDTIVSLATRAYNELGFTGFAGWIYYNEPLLQADRMFALMGRIKNAAPMARFLLWTNGTLVPEECGHYRQFEEVIISAYNEAGHAASKRLAASGVNVRKIGSPAFDTRLHQIEPEGGKAHCLRPFVEFIIDNHGNTHLCCYDWQGKATFGNVFKEDFGVIAQRWRDQLPEIAGHGMSENAPTFCRECGYRWKHYQQHDAAIVDRARRYRKRLAGESAP